jgi:hypothetical protein
VDLCGRPLPLAVAFRCPVPPRWVTRERRSSSSGSATFSEKIVDRFLGEDLCPADFGFNELSEAAHYLPEGAVFRARTVRVVTLLGSILAGGRGIKNIGCKKRPGGEVV